MPQYIQNPSLIGAQMADDLSKQRMNLVGQGISQAVDALNKQAALDAAAQTEMAQAQAFMKANRNPRTGAYEETATAPNYDWDTQFKKLLASRAAARAGVNPSVAPTSPAYRIGPSYTPIAESVYNMTGVPNFYGTGKDAPTFEQILMQGRRPASAPQLENLQLRGYPVGAGPNLWEQFIGGITGLFE
jgi:hypothetical protein